MSAHTPGPWTAREMTHYGEPGTGFWHVDPIGEPDDTWSEADARLIAAALDLLAALKAVEYAGEAGGCPACAGKPHMGHCELHAAIAKAEGKTTGEVNR